MNEAITRLFIEFIFAGSWSNRFKYSVFLDLLAFRSRILSILIFLSTGWKLTIENEIGTKDSVVSSSSRSFFLFYSNSLIFSCSFYYSDAINIWHTSSLVQKGPLYSWMNVISVSSVPNSGKDLLIKNYSKLPNG